MYFNKSNKSKCDFRCRCKSTVLNVLDFSVLRTAKLKLYTDIVHEVHESSQEVLKTTLLVYCDMGRNILYTSHTSLTKMYFNYGKIILIIHLRQIRAC